MCYSNFVTKILNELPMDKEFYDDEQFGFDDDDQIVTDRKIIEKVWYTCVRHGYISKDYGIMAKLINTMKIIGGCPFVVLV